MPTLAAFLDGEDAARYRDQFQDFVVSGGLHGPTAGLVGSPGATTAYCYGKYVTETASITYPNGAAVWVAMDHLTEGNRDSFTRVAGTHYLIDSTSVEAPGLPAGAVWLMYVATASGAVTSVIDLRLLSPVRALATRGLVFSSRYPSLQAAVNALPAEGGTVMVEPGEYVLTQPLRLGNGTVSNESSRSGIYLVGLGTPYGTNYGVTMQPSARILWAGGGAACIEVLGPLSGWGIQNLHIDGTDSATYGILVMSAQGGDVRNLVVQNCTVAGIGSSTWTSFIGSASISSLHNKWTNCLVTAPGTYGVILTSGSAVATTGYNVFENCFIVISGNGIGLSLGAANGNSFVGLHISCGAGAFSPINFAFDNGQSASWPAANMFFNLDPHNKAITQTGHPAPDTIPNMILGLSQESGATVPTVEALAVIHANAAGDLHLTPSHNEDNTRVQGLTVVGNTIAGAPIKTVTSNYVVSVVDTTILADASAGAVLVALPPAIESYGRIIHVKKIDGSGNAVFVDPTGSEWLDGSPDASGLTVQWTSRTVQCDGTAWFRLDRPT